MNAFSAVGNRVINMSFFRHAGEPNPQFFFLFSRDAVREISHAYVAVDLLEDDD